MATGIKFDASNNVIEPTFILCHRNGDFIGRIPAVDIIHAGNFNKANQCSFTVYKSMCQPEIWDQLIDLKLVFVKELDEYYQLTESLTDQNDIFKACTCVSLAESELSQIMLNGYEINTEDDIKRNDYEIATLWNENYPKKSMMHRLFEKAPHYKLEYCDISLQGIQRAFSFNNRSLYDACQDIAKEYKCVFVFDNRADDETDKPRRAVRIYDLQKHCLKCNYRSEFDGPCPKCGADGDLIADGYGEDTTVFINSENLADNITVSVDVDSMKNCFYLEAGDDLLTAAVRAVNPNGTQYLWHISPYMMEDMSPELRNRIESYDESYQYYQKEHVSTLPNSILASYNNLVTKYKSGKLDVDPIPAQIVGYQKLMEIYYQTIDFYLYLHDSMTPLTSKDSTTAQKEAQKIEQQTGTVSVFSVSTLSKASADNAVLARARVVVSKNYKITLVQSNFSNGQWRGKMKLVNYADDEDTAETTTFLVTFNDNYKAYLEQRIEMQLSNESSLNGGAVQLFKSTNSVFRTELKKYAVNQLQIFANCAQSCMDILIQANQAQAGSNYYDLYQDYYQKLNLVNSEIQVREQEIMVIQGCYDFRGNLKTDGVQTVLDKIIKDIQIALDFQTYIGIDLWHELCSYRREDTYSNQNYISDGLDTASLFASALDFLEVAQKEIVTASSPQRSITAPLKNLLVMREFRPLVDHFKVGNWIRVQIDGQIYKLRLIHFETDYKDRLDVEFSDVVETVDGFSDVKSVLDQAGVMATSFDAVKRQARRGDDTTNVYRDWVAKGLDLTNIKLVKGIEDNQEMTIDGHGILGREFNALTEDYDDKQIRIINKGFYYTNDNWEHVQSAIGTFVFWNPETKEIEERYGVIADTLVGSLVLGEKVGIYTESGNIALEANGFTMTTDQAIDPNSDMKFTIQKKYINSQGEEKIKKMLYLDSNGNLVMDGKSINITLSNEDNSDNSLDAYVQTLIQASQDQVLVQMSKEMEGYYTKSEINQTLNSIQTSIYESVENEYVKSSNFTQTLDGFRTDLLESVENEYVKSSSLSQTLGSFKVDLLESVEDEYVKTSSISQLIDSIQTSVMDSVDKEYVKSSTITQTVNGINASITDLEYNQQTMQNELKNAVTIEVLNNKLSTVVTSNNFGQLYETMLTQDPSKFLMGFTKNNTFIKFENGTIMLGPNGMSEQQLLQSGGYSHIGQKGLVVDGIGGVKSVTLTRQSQSADGIQLYFQSGPVGRVGKWAGIGSFAGGNPSGILFSNYGIGDIVGGRVSCLATLDMMSKDIYEIINAHLKYPYLTKGTCEETSFTNCTYSGKSNTFNSSWLNQLKSELNISGSSGSSTPSISGASGSGYILYGSDWGSYTINYGTSLGTSTKYLNVKKDSTGKWVTDVSLDSSKKSGCTSYSITFGSSLNKSSATLMKVGSSYYKSITVSNGIVTKLS